MGICPVKLQNAVIRADTAPHLGTVALQVLTEVEVNITSTLTRIQRLRTAISSPEETADLPELLAAGHQLRIARAGINFE